MGKLKPIRRRDPNAVTFKLVSAPHDDPRVAAASATSEDGENNVEQQYYIWQRCPRKNGRTDIPKELLKVFSPEDFGIHENLTAAQRSKLCREVYGESEIPREALQFSSSDVRAGGVGDAGSRRGKVVGVMLDGVLEDLSEDDEADDSQRAQGGRRIAKKGNEDQEWVIEEWHEDEAVQQELSTATVGPVDSHKTRHENLEVDRYFPDDGHDYESHLRPIRTTTGGGFFISAPVDKHANSAARRGGNLEADIPREILNTPEGRELLAVLNAEGGQNYEGADFLDDNFVAQAQNCKAHVESDLLWGAHIPRDEEPPSLDMSFEERAALLAQLRPKGGFGSDTESDDEFALWGESKQIVGDGRHLGEEEKDLLLKFNKLMDEYDEAEIGELGADDEGVLEKANAEVSEFSGLIKDFLAGETEKNEIWVRKLKLRAQGQADDEPLCHPDEKTLEVTRALLDSLKKKEDEAADRGEDTSSEESDDEERKWDCETILSTRTTIYNHPARISRPPSVAPSTVKLASKLQLPVDYLPPHLQRAVAATAFPNCKGAPPSGILGSVIPEEEDVVELPDVVNRRDKTETSEERRARKKAVKEAKRIIREMKKQNFGIVKSEAKKESQKITQKNPYDIRDGVRHFRYA